MHDGSGWFSVSFRGFLLEKQQRPFHSFGSLKLLLHSVAHIFSLNTKIKCMEVFPTTRNEIIQTAIKSVGMLCVAEWVFHPLPAQLVGKGE